MTGPKEKMPKDLLLEPSEKGLWLLLGAKEWSGKLSDWGTDQSSPSHGGCKYLGETSSSWKREAGGGEEQLGPPNTVQSGKDGVGNGQLGALGGALGCRMHLQAT